MAKNIKLEDFSAIPGTKEVKYRHCIEQINALSVDGIDIIAQMSNICAVLKQQFDFFWVGFYRVSGNTLIVGPYQGPLACTTIAKGRGVCGESWQQAKSIIVPDVNKHAGHIACSSASQSEIVVPVYIGKEIIAVLDVDSSSLNNFDHEDQTALEHICSLLA